MMWVFDLDDTLYLRSEPYLRAFHSLFPGVSLDENELIRTARHYDAESFDRYSRGLITIERMYIERVRDTFAVFGVQLSDEEAEALQAQYSANMRSILLQPGFREIILWGQKHGVRMGILSNGPSKRQRVKITALGLYEFFEEKEILVSDDIGVNKPALAVFREYEKRTGEKPENLWMIGDSYSSDIEGSLKAGWHAVWVKRDFLDNPSPAEYIPDMSSSDEKEIFRFLRETVKENTLP